MGVNNELSFLSLANAGPGYSAIYVDDVGDFAQVHKISIYDSDRGITVLADTTNTQFYGEYVDINGTFTYGTYVSSSNGAAVTANVENYYLFPSASATIGNYAVGPSSSLSLYTAKFLGDSTPNSIAIKLENGAQLEGAAIDIQDWDYGYVVPNTGIGPNFRVVGSMVHDTTTYDFDIQNATTRGRYQGVSNHQKINNVSEDFYWNFLDDEDGENDVTRKLSVTFADGTHTDATTLIFRGSPMGVLAGGEITISGSLTVTTATGFGYLHDPINPEVFKRFDWVDGDITLSPNTNNYIYINSNGILSAAGSTPNYAQNIILGRVVTNSTGIEFIDQSPWNAEHTANAISKFNREALGPVFAEGSIVTEDVTPFKLDVTQGNYFFSENNFLPTGTASINLTQYYQSASVWARYTSSVVPSRVYASGSALVPMSASAYTKHTVYLVGDGADEEYFLVVNNNQYATLVQAENADLPTIPTYFNDGVVPLAAVYVQSGSANITQIQDIRPIIGFRAAGVNASSVHGNLLGLTADDHLQYLRVDGARQLTGDLGLGGNDIYNANTVSASSFIGSLQGTASYANQANNSNTADYATIAGNGGVTSIIAGSGTTLIPTSGVGAVTVISSGTTTVISGSNVTQSFSNLSTWTFNHNLGTRTPIINVFDTNYKQIIPQDIELVSTSSATITFPTIESGFAIASLGGVTGNAVSSSYSLFATYATTASSYAETDPVYIAQKPTLATTGSNIFRGNQTITGSLNISGSTTQIGNNTLIGTTTLSGSILVSGSQTFNGSSSFYGTHLLSGSNTIRGNTFMFGNIQVSGSSNFNNTEFIVTGSTSILGNFNVKGTSVFSDTTFTITGSQYFTGSSFINGNQSLTGNSTITGSLNVIGNINVISGSSFTRWGNKLFNYGQFSSTQTQSGSADTTYAMKFNTTDFALGVSIVSQSRITVENTGIYNLQFSAQLGNTANSTIDFDIWFAYTGSNITNSNTQVEITKQSGTSGRNIAAWNFATPIAANDYIEIYWSCNEATGQIQAIGPQTAPTRPAIPSVIATLTQIA